MVRSVKICQPVRLSVRGPAVDLGEVRFTSLHEEVNQHARLSGRFEYRGGLDEGLDVVGASVDLHVAEGERYVSVFQGVIDEAEVAPGELSFVAFGMSKKAGRVPDATALLKGVRRLGPCLGSPGREPHTDFTTIVALAGLHGLFVVAPGIGPVRLSDGSDGPLRRITPDLILPGSDRLQVRRLPAHPKHDREGADRFLRWQGRLLHPAASVRVGHRLRLKDHAVSQEMVVTRRDLVYQAQILPVSRQLVNMVDCTPTAWLPFVGPLLWPAVQPCWRMA